MVGVLAGDVGECGDLYARVHAEVLQGLPIVLGHIGRVVCHDYWTRANKGSSVQLEIGRLRVSSAEEECKEGVPSSSSNHRWEQSDIKVEAALLS